MSVTRGERRNRLLSTLSADDRALIEPLLERIALPFRYRLQAENRTVEYVYFPDSGIASVVAIAKGARLQSEVGLIGREGMTGTATVLGSHRAPFDIFMQVEGSGWRMATEDVHLIATKSPTIQNLFLKSAYLFMVQVAHTALANAHGQLEERLARWLLMACDRSDGDEMVLTHEFLALMLGVRRAGVTTALQHLTARGLIETARGSVTIRDREGLEESAAGLYGVPEAEFERLFHYSP
ncbi:Crp/Fnr family transcriptional regulator [Hyphomicrobium sp. MC8b]|jgi:CRP-like cAMP-binding protein|uniref:Crp/Fnr family transcriptional regulator n=1 Tax=unclassified Hyphomicrobium TaxID=2619925 RepID=UPI00391A77F4